MNGENAQRLLEDERANLEMLATAHRRRLAETPNDVDELDREQLLTIVQLAEDRAIDVGRALAKLAAGRYGACETCAAPIPDERLEARPDARFCEDHERDWEFRHLGFRAPKLTRPPDDAGEPGWRELATLPEDDELEPPEELSAEEHALHEEVTGEWLDRDLVEAAEAITSDVTEEPAAEAEVEAVLREEERLG